MYIYIYIYIYYAPQELRRPAAEALQVEPLEAGCGHADAAAEVDREVL